MALMTPELRAVLEKRNAEIRRLVLEQNQLPINVAALYSLSPGRIYQICWPERYRR